MKPLISVVIPSYNLEAFTPLTVESVLAQTHRPTEIIISERSALRPHLEGREHGTPAGLEEAL